MKSHGGKKPVRVHLLNGESVLLVFDSKAYVKEVFEQICSMHSIKDTQLFGLTAIVEKEYHFMDLKQKLSKYASKEWNRSSRKKESPSKAGQSTFEMQFQVQFFVVHPKLISDSQSRHHYYLQLKRNVLHSKVVVQDEVLLGLAATALHLDLGIYDKCLHAESYFKLQDYVPKWFIEKWGEDYLTSHLPSMHADLATTSHYQAQSNFIQQASTIDDVPVHYYKLYKTKTEKDPSVVLAITHLGIRILHVTRQRSTESYVLNFEFPWSKVGRLFFATKRFEIYPEDLPASRKLIYYTGSHSRSKYLLRLLRNTHSLFLSLNPLAEHLRKANGSNRKKRYRESYISGIDLEVKTEKGKEKDWIRNHNNMTDIHPNEQQSDSKSFQSNSGLNSVQASDTKMDIKQQSYNDSIYGDDPFSDGCELVNSPSGGVICVTQEHLEAPPIKNLSVTNLMDAILGEVDTLKQTGYDTAWPSIANNFPEKEADIVSGSDYFEANLLSNEMSKRKNETPRRSKNMTKSSQKSPMMKTLSDHSAKPATVIRKASNISEILDLFPDVSSLQTVTDRKPNQRLLKSASEDRLGDICHSTSPFTDYKDLPQRQPPSYEAVTRSRRTQSMDIELIFDFDTYVPTVADTTSKPSSQSAENSYQHSTQQKYKADALLPNLSEKNGFLNVGITDHNSNIYSNSYKTHNTTELEYMVNGGSPRKTEGDLVKTTSLSRSQRQNDIPFAFGRNNNRFCANQNSTIDDRSFTCPDKLETQKMSEICNQTLTSQRNHSRLTNGKSYSFYLQPLESSIKLNSSTKIRPVSASAKPQGTTLRHRSEHQKKSRSRPRSLDFTSYWNSNDKSKTSRPSSAKRQTMFMLENFTEVIV